LEPPRTTQERKTEKEMGENNVRGSWNSGKDLEKGPGNSWQPNLLGLLHGGPVFLSRIRGNWLTTEIHTTAWINLSMKVIRGSKGQYEVSGIHTTLESMYC
jgi:hypothetical protein